MSSDEPHEEPPERSTTDDREPPPREAAPDADDPPDAAGRDDTAGRDNTAGADNSADTDAGRTAEEGGRGRRHGWRRLLPTWRMALGTTLVGLLLLCGAFALGYAMVGIPSANAAATAQSNVFYYSDGRTQIASSGTVNRESVPLSQIPKSVQRAALAAEDRGFYHESAVDPRAMVRAGWNTVNGKGRQSGSTITQQYVKNYYLNQEQTVKRKVEEFFIAIKLDREETKDQILEGYLNTSYFGRNAYGIQAAAQAYYGEDADRLDTAQGAYLASLLNAPSAYDVSADPQNRDRAIARWNYVLKGMVKEHWLTPTARLGMRFPDPRPLKVPAGLSGQRGYLVEAVRNYLIENGVIDENTLNAGGYRITTTIDKSKEDDFVKAAQDQLLDKRADSRRVDDYLRAGGVSVDPSNGHVVALYGGIDYTQEYVDNATRRDYQVGSTFKPYVFASAVQNHSTTQDGRPITPRTIYQGTNHRQVQARNGPVGYAPANEDDVSYGDIPVSEATNKSVNAVYAQMAEDVGPTKVRDTAVALGLPSATPDLTAYPSIALGVATASPLDMAQGYATLDNHGVRVPYTLVAKVEKDGHSIPLPDRSSHRAVSRRAADTTTSMLRSVVDSADGTGTAARAAGRPAAGKTGTAEDDKAAWFAGYTPDLVTVVAVMGQDSTTGRQEPLYGATGLARINGGGYPARIWADYTSAALRGGPSRDFDLRAERGGGGGLPSASPTGSGSPTPPSGPPPITPPPTGPPTSPPPMNPSGGGAGGGGLIGGQNGGGTGGGTGGDTGGGTTSGGGTGGTGGPPGGGAGGANGGPPGATAGPADTTAGTGRETVPPPTYG